MEEELRNLIKVWISAFISICYCYYFSSQISKGLLRLFSLLPIFIIFLLLPLFLSSVHLCVISAFFLSWLANFKLLLFAFDQEPLSPLPSNLFRFFCFACFPIKTNQNPSPNNKPMRKRVLAFKVLIFSVFLNIYGNDYHYLIPRLAFLFMFTIHVYIETELILFFVGALLSTLLGCEIEPAFNDPYLSTSLQDFWSRRWNITVPNLLRVTVHIPVQRFCSQFLGPNRAFYGGVLATFLVSGLMHELIYFYMIRKSPTWEVTCFFVLHGVVTSVEMAAKRTRWLLPPHRAVSRLAVTVFVFVTAGLLFYPQVLRNDVDKRVISECLLAIEFFKRVLFRILM